jgi:AraC-like DNA-binding protein
VSDQVLASLDWALRGGTCALVLLMAIALLRDYGQQTAARLGAAFAIGTASYAITSAIGFSPRLGLWTYPLIALSVGNNAVFWTFSAALFDDSFRLRWWHGGIWLVLVVTGFAVCLAPGRVLGLALTTSSFIFAGLAAAQAIGSWRADLIERRRRLRLFVVIASSAYIVLNATAELIGVPHSAPAVGHLASASALLAIAGAIAVSMLRVGQHSLFPALSESSRPVSQATPTPDEADQRLLATLAHVMSSERAYRQDGLTIATLAGQVGVAEYKLRRQINQALGFRNFNSFVNSYRIAEVKAALADPKQAEVPVLTIALDAGFSSLGPFNRAFKAETGLTPSEFRRRQGTESTIGGSIPESASRISNKASADLGTQ